MQLTTPRHSAGSGVRPLRQPSSFVWSVSFSLGSRGDGAHAGEAGEDIDVQAGHAPALDQEALAGANLVVVTAIDRRAQVRARLETYRTVT
jgi:hypothetical protein